MRKLLYLIAAVALSGLALSGTPSSAGPLAGGLASGNGAVPQLDESLIQKIHGWHCRKRWSKRRGWHRHRRACYDDDYSYYPYHGYPGYGLGFAPFFGFTFFDDDDHHHRRHHRWRRHHNW